MPLAATELGAPEIRSYLGEPLQARIALDNVDLEQIDVAKTGLAPPLEWARQGAGVFPESLQLSAAIERDEQGYFIEVRSENPVNEPVLQLLLDLQLPESALVSKPYILFLDPKPSPGDRARNSLAMRRSQRQADARSTDAASSANNSQASRATVARPAIQLQSTASTATSYGPVQSGQTLWGIAQRHAAATPLTAQQWLVAFQNANPNALQDPENVNTLRSGAMLKIPDVNSVAGISHYDAVIRLREQNMAWSNTGGRLQVLDADDGGASGDGINNSVAALRIARLQEELLTVKRENAALREQVEVLDAEIDQRDVEIQALQANVRLNAAGNGESLDALVSMEYGLNGNSNAGSGAATELDVSTDQPGSNQADTSLTESAKSTTDQFDVSGNNADDSVSDHAAREAATSTAGDESTAAAILSAQNKPALAAQLPDATESWLQQFDWLPGSTNGMIVFAAMTLLLLAALFWALRSMFSRSSDDTDYQAMLNELNRHRKLPPTKEPDGVAGDLGASESAAVSADSSSANGPSANELGQEVGDSIDHTTAEDHADQPVRNAAADTAAATARQHADLSDPSSKADPAAVAEDVAIDLAWEMPAAEDAEGDDWRDQINAIMDEMEQEQQQHSSQDDQASRTAAGTDDDHAAVALDLPAATTDSDSGAQAEPAAETVAEQLPAMDMNMGMDVDVDVDRDEQVMAGTDLRQSAAGQSTAVDDNTSEVDSDDMIAEAAETEQGFIGNEPLKFDLSASTATADEDITAADDDAPAAAGKSAQDSLLSAPLAFDHGNEPSAAQGQSAQSSNDPDRLADGDEPVQTDRDDVVTAAASATEQPVDDLPPLSFDVFDDDLTGLDDDAAPITDQAAAGATHQQSDTDADSLLQSEFDPFADSIPEPNAGDGDDWLDIGSDDAASAEALTEQAATPSAPSLPAEQLRSDAAASPAAPSSVTRQPPPQDSSTDSTDSTDDDDEDEFDSIEIKLDLARAYLAMGDYQAMRILLDEIGDQGNTQQRDEIAALLHQAQS